jgi:hypothetical protein
MRVMPPASTLLHSTGDSTEVPLPAGFVEALGHIQDTVVSCVEKGIPGETVLAAMLAETLPRLVALYGPTGVAGILGQLASEIATNGNPSTIRQ